MSKEMKNDVQVGMKEAQEIANSEYAFRIFTINRIVKLQALMTELVGGNGHKGRIPCLESKVRVHDKILWMVAGAVFLATVLLKYGPQMLAWIKG